jgi:diacylglycerol kinase (ATP)
MINEVLPGARILYVNEPAKLIQESAASAKSSDVVIACGGDGTAQSVARGVFGTSATMGLIPIGSGNDFAKSIGLKTNQDILYYLKIIVKGFVRNIDVPTINEEIFINTAGIGFDGLTNYYAAQSRFLKGSLKYTYAGLKSFFSAKKFTLSGNLNRQDISKKVWMAAVANGSTEGGKYLISPKSDNADGTLELIIVPGYSRLKLLYAFIWMSFGNALGGSFSEIITFKSGSLKLTEVQKIHLDGENGGEASEFLIYLQKQRLPVIGNN